ncbi:MAG: hypothetical protein JOZ33_14210 [Acidobacteriaceae bacterium]|nr:hypothetical protein [Acidobacteriaceae bacterium]
MEPSISSTTLSNGDVMFYARQLMVIPQGGKSCRQAELLLPPLLIQSTDMPAGFCTPTIVATIDSLGVGGGTVMGIYSLVVQPSEGKTQIAVSAQIIGGTEVDYEYFCNFRVIGTLT